MLSVSLLGGFNILHGQNRVTEINTPRLQSLFAYLLLHRNAPQSRHHLAFLFWPDTSEAQARTNLRNLLHNLRRLLPDPDACLEITVHTLQWRSVAPFTLDVDDFTSALAVADQPSNRADPDAMRQAIEQALALYKGDLLPNCYDDWIIPLRENLRQTYLSALERLVHILEEQRDYPTALLYARRLLQHDPLLEAAYRHLMRLYALNGDLAGALRVYHTCTTVLQRELDVAPSPATRLVYEQILGASSPPSPAIHPTTAFSPMLSRQTEWALMLAAWRSVTSGSAPHLLVQCGEAGIGKSRLLEELLLWASRQGLPSASARCYAAEGRLAFAPVTAWLRAAPLPPLEDVWLAEVARLLPELLTLRPNLPQPLALTEAWQRQRLFEALARALLHKNQPQLLAIDDLQWCDQDTLEWLHFLLRFDPATRLLVIAAYRPEEISPGHPLLTTLQALRPARQLTEIELQPLDENATHTLAAQVAGVQINRPTASWIYRQTEGNPLFIIETVRAGLHTLNQPHPPALPIQDLSSSPVLPDPPQTTPAVLTQNTPADLIPGYTHLPPRVHSILAARLAQLSPPLRELAGLAATIGREFNFKLLATASALDEDTLVHALDQLWQRRIVRENDLDTYDFSHDKLREVAYLSLSTTHRRMLHLHVARALESLHAADLDPVTHQLAAHYERAGLPRLALPCYLHAAQLARKVFANPEAIALLRHALDLLPAACPDSTLDEPTSMLALQLWEELGDLLSLTAYYDQAYQAYQHAQTHLRSADCINHARLHRKAAILLREQRHYGDALAACQRAEASLGIPPDRYPDPWWDEWLELQIEQVWTYYWLDRLPEMEELVNKVQPSIQSRASAANRMRFLMASCLLYLRKERYTVSDQMLSDSHEALALSQQWGSLKTRIECQFELGFLHLWRGELPEAEANLHAALQLAEPSGFVSIQTIILTYLTVLYRFLNQPERVLAYALRSQQSAEAAHMPDYVAAAKANQAWLAWRDRDLLTAQQLGQDALLIWQQSQLVYPFQWQALWPLIAVALAHDREDDAWTYAQQLLEPAQQYLPGRLNTTLQAAVHAKGSAQLDGSRSHLDHALQLASELGYL